MRGKGTAILEALRVTGGAAVGRVLTSDAAGNATWQTVSAASAPPLVSTLPSSPTDGQEVFFQNAAMATAGVLWRLRYRAGSASAFKWEALPTPYYSGMSGDITTANTALTALTNGPSIAAPLAGTYMVRMQIQMISSVAPQSAGNMVANVRKNATTSLTGTTMIATGGGISPGEERFDLAAADALTIAVANANAVSTRFVNGAITLTPIRVG